MTAAAVASSAVVSSAVAAGWAEVVSLRAHQKQKSSRPAGFEPTQALPNRFLVDPLNRSGTVACGIQVTQCAGSYSSCNRHLFRMIVSSCQNFDNMNRFGFAKKGCGKKKRKKAEFLIRQLTKTFPTQRRTPPASSTPRTTRAKDAHTAREAAMVSEN